MGRHSQPGNHPNPSPNTGIGSAKDKDSGRGGTGAQLEGERSWKGGNGQEGVFRTEEAWGARFGKREHLPDVRSQKGGGSITKKCAKGREKGEGGVATISGPTEMLKVGKSGKNFS